MRVKAYDIFDILINYWQVQLKSANALAAQLEEWQPTKENIMRSRVFSRVIGQWKIRLLIR